MSGLPSDRTSLPAILGEFGAQLTASSLLTPRQFDELNEKIETGKWPGTSRELASRLVYERWLTEYQAKRLLANKGAALTVGRYTILDRVGSGAMGRVFRAQHQLMGRVVALKVIAPELMSNPRVVSRFLREMRLVARLDHPNVVRAFDADQVEGVFFIAMEYVPGKSLGDLLKKGPLPAVDVIRFASQAALGLGHAHHQGILHRDVKPSNLLLTEDRKTLKVLDLGLGTLMETDPEESFRTADGIAVGTIDYMSPEQASGKPLDGRSDLYSLACCMYHLMTGQCPFKHENPIHRLAMRIHAQPTPITDYLPGLPVRMVQVMEKMLATNPDDRFQSGEEASEALRSLMKKKKRSGTTSDARTVPDTEAEDAILDDDAGQEWIPKIAAPASDRLAWKDAMTGIDIGQEASSETERFAEPWFFRHPTLTLLLGLAALATSFMAGFFTGRWVR